jgi:hypothetical protein
MSVLRRSGSRRAILSMRRVGVRSVGRENGAQWDGEGVGERFSCRLSLGFEAYEMTSCAYAPVRIWNHARLI